MKFEENKTEFLCRPYVCLSVWQFPECYCAYKIAYKIENNDETNEVWSCTVELYCMRQELEPFSAM